MPTPFVPVTVTLVSQDGIPYQGVVVRARLDTNEVYQGIIISDQAEAVTNALGVAVLNCFPNAPAPAGLGTQGSLYRFSASIPGARALHVNARVPNVACRLEDILVADAVPALSDAETALLQIQAAVSTSTDARDEAVAAAATAAHIYPGTYALAPTQRPDGSPIQAGDRYIGTDNFERAYIGGAWVNQTADAAASAAAAAISKTGADAAKAGADAANVGATAAKAAAEAARDAANTSARAYAAAQGTAAGLADAAVAVGQTFAVVSADLLSYAVYRKDAGPVATPMFSQYTKAYLDSRLIDNRSLAAGDTYATPPSVIAETVASATPTSTGTATLKGVALSTGHPATMAGVARSFSAKFSTALAGRKVEFYVFTPSGGDWVCTYASGLQDGSANGVNTFNVPIPANVRIGVGDIVGAYTDAAANADGFFLATSGGPVIGPTVANAAGGRVAQGATITSGAGGYATNGDRYYGISVATAHEAVLVPARWANLASGWLKLDASAKVPAPILPTYIAQSDSITTPAVVEYDPALSASKNVARAAAGTATWSLASPTANFSLNNVYPSGRVVVGWINGQSNGLSTGILRRVRVPGGGTVSAGGKIQMWVVRPTAALPTGGTASFTYVATIGEVSADPTGYYREIDGLFIPVQAGDMIAMRPINTGLGFGTGAVTFNSDYFIDPLVAGTSLADLANGITGAAVSSSRRFDIYAEVTTGPALTGRGANTPLVLDTIGNIPANRVRAADAPWAGLKIAAVGTSITAGGNATNNNGYIARLAAMLQCQVVNNAVGSSGIVWDGTRALSLGATQAQLTAAGFSAAQSYEVKVLGQAADLFIFDHGYNDGAYPIGNIGDSTAATFYGAYNKVIQALLAERPSQRFMLITPHSLYSPWAGGLNANTVAIRNAMLAIADKYACPILDWTSKTQLSSAQAVTFYADGSVHPNDAWHAVAARILYRFILDNA